MTNNTTPYPFLKPIDRTSNMTDTPLTALRALWDAIYADPSIHGEFPSDVFWDAEQRAHEVLERYRANTDDWTTETIRELRHAHGLTQKQMAETIGVTLNQYREWEQGRRLPNHENQQRLSALAQKGQGQ